MQEDLLTAPPEFKLYKENAIVGATFLGGPLVAGYLAAENFRHLGQPARARTAWMIAILSTIVILGASILIPAAEKIPSILFPLTYTFVTRFLIQTYQRDAIVSHIAQGGPTYSGWRAVWIALVGVVVLFAIVLGILGLLDKNFLQSN
jgi:hypothetical protein